MPIVLIVMTMVLINITTVFIVVTITNGINILRHTPPHSATLRHTPPHSATLHHLIHHLKNKGRTVPILVLTLIERRSREFY
jgi:sterol desaturase/sphingolipid hydroxylase (fatty acid hydroxylase superfamily)